MVLKWHEALKQWNAHKKSINPAHVFALPRKGTPEHAEVVAIQKPVKKSLAELRAEHAAKKAAEPEEAEPPKSKAEKKKEAAAKKHAAEVRKNERVRSGAPLRARPGPKPGAAAAEKRSHREEIIRILEEMYSKK